MSRNKEENSTSRPILAIVRVTILVVTAVACMAPSIHINITHQMAHGGETAMAKAAASAMAVLMAGVSPLAIRRAWASREWVIAGVFFAVFIVCVQFNLIAAVKVSSIERSERTGTVTKATTAVVSLQRSLEALTAEKETFKGRINGATADILRAEQAAMKNDLKWDATKQCTDATKQASREYCAEFDMKTAAIAAALKVEALDRDIKEARGKLDAAVSSPDASVGQPADPQTATIATALETVGVRAPLEKITSALNLELALILEVISSFGPLLLAYVSGLDKALISVRPDKKMLSGQAPDNIKKQKVSGSVRRSVRRSPDKRPDKLSGQANTTENAMEKFVRKFPKKLRLVALSGGAGQAPDKIPDSLAGQPDSRTDFDEKVRAMTEAGQTVRTIMEQLGTTKWQVEEARKRLNLSTKSMSAK
jgi:hypothetical protein